MKASPWEKEDAQHEGIPILDYRVPKTFVHASGRLTGMTFERVRAEYDDKGRRKLVPTGEPDEFHACDEVLIAVGQENAFPWIERDLGIEFDEWGMPVVDKVTHQSTLPRVLFGGDAAFGPKNIIWAVAHGHSAAISIDKLLHGEDTRERPDPMVQLDSQKMGIHEWSYDNAVSPDERYIVPWSEAAKKLDSMHVEVELGFDVQTAWKETQRCLNCDVQTVFTRDKCIECDACVDICPTDCITFTANGEEAELRTRLTAPALNTEQDLYVSEPLENHAGHGQGRGRVPALQPVRGALPDGGVGHAEVPAAGDVCGLWLPQQGCAGGCLMERSAPCPCSSSRRKPGSGHQLSRRETCAVHPTWVPACAGMMVGRTKVIGGSEPEGSMA